MLNYILSALFLFVIPVTLSSIGLRRYQRAYERGDVPEHYDPAIWTFDAKYDHVPEVQFLRRCSYVGITSMALGVAIRVLV